LITLLDLCVFAVIRTLIRSSGSSHGNTKTPRNGSYPKFILTQTKDSGNGEQKGQNTNQ